MKLCSACSKTLPKESFSKRQWALNQQQRKCKDCIDANQVVQLKVKTPPKIDSTKKHAEKQPLCSADDEGASCWIWLEAGPDDDDQPLRRDCSCRGTDAGFVHLSCTIEYAKQKSQQWDGYDDNEFDMFEFVKPWSDCASCRQPYQNELALDLLTEFVTFVEGKYPDDLQLQLITLEKKVFALASLVSTQKESAKQYANEMLALIGQMRIETPSLAQDFGIICQSEDTVYSALGRIALDEETKESTNEAVGHFEKQRDIYNKIGWTEGVFAAESNIAHALSKCEGGDISVDEKLKYCQEMCELCVKQFGQVHSSTIHAGVNLAVALKNADHCVEAERLLTKLASTSKQVHGPDHQLTQWAESELQKCKERGVSMSFEGEVKRFQALRYEEMGGSASCKGHLQTRETSKRRKHSRLTQSILSSRLALLSSVVD